MGKLSKKVFTNSEMKASARAFKRKEAQKEKQLASRSLHDDDTRQDRKLKLRRKALGSSSDAAGDGGLFSEEKISFAKKPTREEAEAPAKSRYADVVLHHV